MCGAGVDDVFTGAVDEVGAFLHDGHGAHALSGFVLFDAHLAETGEVDQAVVGFGQFSGR
jgi:hypothetical protein